MPYDVFVEIGEELDPDLRERLLALAYRRSRSQSVAIVLRGVSPSAVDRHLDPVVESLGIAVRGVRYLEPHQVEEALASNGARRPIVLTRDASWVPRGADGRAPDVRSPEEGLALLAGEASPTA